MAKIAILIFGGLAVLGVLFAHPIGPALIVLGITPWEGALYKLLGWAGNFLTPLPVIALLIRTPIAYWSQIFLGTRIQAVSAFFIVILVISHLLSAPLFGIGVMIGYAIRLMVFTLMCLVAWSVRDPKQFETAARVMVVSMAVLTFIGLIDYFVGTSLLPGAAEKSLFLGEGTVGQTFDTHLTGALRFAPAGGSQNRYAMWLLLPLFVSLGWAMSARVVVDRLIAFGCFSVMTLGLVASISRANYLGFAVGMLVLLPTALRINRRQVLGLAAVGAFGLFAAVLVLSQTPTWDAILSRLSSSSVENTGARRFGLFIAGLRAFFDSPIFGVGIGQMPLAIAKYLPTNQAGLDSHNSYVNILVETGLLGFVPWITVIIMTLRQLSRRAVASAGRWEYWRPFVRSAMIALLFPMYFNDFAYERYVWFCVAIAIVLERYETAEIAQRIRARYAALHTDAEEAVGVASTAAEGTPAGQH